MKPTAFNRFAPLADPWGPPRCYRVRLQLDVRIDIVVPSATDRDDALLLRVSRALTLFLGIA